MVETPAARVLIEEFPQTELQARYFSKNCVDPTHVFYVRCSLDDSQDRMLTLGKTNPLYLPSAILSKKIKMFNEHAVKLLPFLKQTTNLVELDTSSKSSEKSFQDICKIVEPTVLHIRSFAEGSNSDQDVVKEQMVETLTKSFGYAEINVNELISLENERKTELGTRLLAMVSTGKMVPADLIVSLLRKVIYSGDGRSKFILSGGFPFTVEHAKSFETHVS